MVFGAWTAGYLQINGVDLSDYVREMVLNASLAELPDNKHGDNTLVVRAGLESWQVAATFLQDFGAAKIDSTLSPLRQVGTSPFNLVIGGGRSDPSSTDPWYKGLCILTSYTPARGIHGANLEATALFQVVSGVLRITNILEDQRLRPLDHSTRKRPVPHSSRKRMKVYTGWP